MSRRMLLIGSVLLVAVAQVSAAGAVAATTVKAAVPVSTTAAAAKPVATTAAAAAHAATTAKAVAAAAIPKAAAPAKVPSGEKGEEPAPTRWIQGQTTLPANFQGPGSVLVDATGNVFVVNQDRRSIVRINAHDDSVTNVLNRAQVRLLTKEDKAGTVSYREELVTIAPKDLALAPSEGLYFSDMLHNSIFKLTRNGLLTRIAGTGEAGFVDGRSLESKFDGPRGIAIDAESNIIVADSNNHCIRVVNVGKGLKESTLSTLAGVCGVKGDKDGAQLGAATLDTPSAVALDADGKVFFADRSGLRVISDGNVKTLMLGVRAGALKVYKDTLFIADTYNRCIRSVATKAPTENWQFAGTCESSFLPGVNTKRTAADDADVMFQFPVGIAVSNSGDIVYVGDADAGKVYKLFRKEPTPSPLTSELLAQMAADIEALKAKVGL